MNVGAARTVIAVAASGVLLGALAGCGTNRKE